MEQRIVSAINEEARIRRECKGRVLCIQRKVNQFLNSDNFYVESESLVGKYYYVKFVFESSESSKPYFWCTCPDFNSNRAEMCKHCWACFYAKRLNLVQQIDKKLPICQSKKGEMITPIKPKSIADQYKNYSIRDLNELEKAEIEEAEQYKRQSYESDIYDF